MADGSEGLLMASNLTSALSDIARAQEDGSWRADRITLGRDVVLEGKALRDAVKETMPRVAA